nr:light-regulated protein [Ipomoea batatas]
MQPWPLPSRQNPKALGNEINKYPPDPTPPAAKTEENSTNFKSWETQLAESFDRRVLICSGFHALSDCRVCVVILSHLADTPKLWSRHEDYEKWAVTCWKTLVSTIPKTLVSPLRSISAPRTPLCPSIKATAVANEALMVRFTIQIALLSFQLKACETIESMPAQYEMYPEVKASISTNTTCQDGIRKVERRSETMIPNGISWMSL